jgi:molecular chaperone IbpA
MENAAMRGPDLSALWRSSVGFDRMLGVIDDSFREEKENYPPHDIEKTGEDKYRISLAVAGYTRDAIAITAEHNILTIEARKPDEGDSEYLYRGISRPAFRLVFNLADFVEVKQALFENGLLQIELERQVPEAMKPRRIPIGGATITDRAQQRDAA